MPCLVMQVRSFIVIISNYEDAGFKPIKHAGIKLWDISKGEDSARPLVDYAHLSKFEQEQKTTQVGGQASWSTHRRPQGLHTVGIWLQ